MSSRKVRYSCVVFCLLVLLGFSWSAPAAAGDAADLRFAAGPNWGGAGTPVPVPLPSAKTKPAVIPAKASEPWDVLWMDVWQKSNQIYRIGVADTLRQAPGCTGNLGLEVIVEQTIRAIRDRKYGDAVRSMAQFQDRSLCLNFEGVRGLEFALSYYTDRAIIELPADQRRIAIHGTFNLGMLAYDQISYTGRSWWQVILRLDYPQMVAQMNAYPAPDLGLWSYDFENGLLVQSASKQALLDKLATLGNPVIGSPAGGTAGGIPSGPTGSGKGGTGFMAGSAGTGAGVVGCVVAASGSTGGRGMVTCMQKAMAGIRPSVGDVLAGPIDPGVSVRDSQCLLSKELKPYVAPPETNKPKKPEPTPTVPKPYTSPDQKEPPKSDSTSKENKGAWETFKGWFTLRTAQGDPGDPGAGGVVGGACGNASNAARRAQAVYDCYQGGGTAAAGGGSPPPRGIDPTIALTTEPQMSGRATGMIACLSQGGSLVRLSVNDPRCLKAKCVQGEQCSCEGTVAGSQGQVVGGGVGSLDPWTSPYGGNCPDPPCGSATGGGGTVTPPKPPPVPPPQVTPSTTPVPATRGIGTVSPLQQKGTIPLSPLQQIGR